MSNLYAREMLVNTTEGYRFGDTDWYETSSTTTGDLFREMQREYGRCVSSMYNEKETDGKWETIRVGWVFVKTVQYEDTDETYLQETWVEISDEEPVKIPSHYEGAHSPLVLT